MRYIDMKWILFVLMLSAVSLPAQHSASTLEQLTRRAPVVLDVRMDFERIDGATRVVQFTVLRQLRGKSSASFTLAEPAQQHCGSMLSGLVKGERYWVFAQSNSGQLVPIGASRGVVHATNASTQAIEALLRVAAGASRLRVLAEQLSSGDRRVSQDAALALPHVVGLETAAAAVRAKIRLQVGQAVATADASAPHLLLAYARSEPSRAARLAWSIVAKPPRPELERPAAELLLRALPAKVASETAPIANEEDPERQLRMARVLVAIAPNEATSAARRWLNTSAGVSRVHASAALIALGVESTQVDPRQSARDLAAAERLAKQLRPARRFRAIRP